MIKHQREKKEKNGKISLDEHKYNVKKDVVAKNGTILRHASFEPCRCTDKQHKDIRRKFLLHFRLFFYIVGSATYSNLRELVTDDHDFHIVTEHMVNRGLLKRVIIPRNGKKPTEIFQNNPSDDAKDITYLLVKELFRFVEKKKSKDSEDWNDLLDRWYGEGFAGVPRTHETTDKAEKDLRKTIKYWADYFKTQLNMKMKEWHKVQDIYKQALGLS